MAGDYYIPPYLGCVVDEYGYCRKMVDGRAKAGARALSDWLRNVELRLGRLKGYRLRGCLKC